MKQGIDPKMRMGQFSQDQAIAGYSPVRIEQRGGRGATNRRNYLERTWSVVSNEDSGSIPITDVSVFSSPSDEFEAVHELAAHWRTAVQTR
jgi:hypothetical protein